MSTQENDPAGATPPPPKLFDTTLDGCGRPVPAQLLLELMDPLLPVLPVAAVHLMGWCPRPRRLQHPLQSRLPLEEAR